MTNYLIPYYQYVKLLDNKHNIVPIDSNEYSYTDKEQICKINNIYNHIIIIQYIINNL